MTIEGLVHSTLELHATIACKRSLAIDLRLQDVIKQYNALKPASHEIEELYKSENLASLLSDQNKTSPELMEKVKKIEAVIFKFVAEMAPDLKEKIDRQDRFVKACMEPCVRDGSDLSSLESILKEGPVDFDAVQIPIYENTVFSLQLYAASSKAPNDRLLTFLLQKGMPITNEDTAIHYLFTYKREHGVWKTDLLEAFLRNGLNLNAPIEKILFRYPNLGQKLIMDTLQENQYSEMRDFVFHGAGFMDSDNILRGTAQLRLLPEEFDKRCKELKEAFRLRDEMLEKMQKELHPKERKAYGDLSVAEREKLAHLCHETYNFRIAFQQPSLKVEKELEDRRVVHSAFITACLDGKLEEAEKLLSQDIDINANLIAIPSLDEEHYPLLNHACMLGKVELVDFLLKHGAKFNIGSDRTTPLWLPPYWNVLSPIYQISKRFWLSCSKPVLILMKRAQIVIGHAKAI